MQPLVALRVHGLSGHDHAGAIEQPGKEQRFNSAVQDDSRSVLGRTLLTHRLRAS